MSNGVVAERERVDGEGSERVDGEASEGEGRLGSRYVDSGDCNELIQAPARAW